MNTYHLRRRLLILAPLLISFAVAVGLPPMPDSAFSQNPIQSQLIESDDPLVLRHGDWTLQSASSASGGAYLYNTVPASATFDTAPANVPAFLLNFTGPSVEIVYATGPSLGILAVEVDDVVLRTIITTADTTHYQQRVIINYLTDESHTLQVYPAQGTVAVDAFFAQLPTPDTIAAAPTCPRLDTPQLVGYRPDGTHATISDEPISFSADGRYVAFLAEDIGLVPNDFNEHIDVFLRDMQTCTTELISVTPAGLPANGPSVAPVVSGDGRYVAFKSWASDIVPGKPPTTLAAIFVRDRQLGITTVESNAANGDWGDGHADWPGMSSDGRFIAFVSNSNNLVPGDSRSCFGVSNISCPDVFLRDRVANTLILISHTPAGTASNGGDYIENLFVSNDGNWVAYESGSADLVADDFDSTVDVFLYDRLADQTTLVSRSYDGTRVWQHSYTQGLSGDGRYTLFRTTSDNIVPNDLNNADDAFVYDRVTGQTRRVSVATNGDEANYGMVWRAMISSDGASVAFLTDSTNLLAGEIYYRDIYIHDLQTGETRWASAGIGGVSINRSAELQAFSPDGQWLVFRTTARLHPDDNNADNEVDTYIVPATGFTFVPHPPPDMLTVFNPDSNMLSRVDIHSIEMSSQHYTYNTYPTGRTTTGQWVMGDWDGDGHDSPAQFRLGAMIYTNDLTTTTNWTGIWLGPNGYPVAGRFDPTVNHDCVGVVDSFEFPPLGTGFALYFTCDLTSGVQPPLDVQWLSVLLPDTYGFSGTHQFAAGDFDGDGVDSIAVRRGRYITWTNVPPIDLLSAFDQAQYFRPVVDDIPEGYFVVGDWDSYEQDNFGIYYPDGLFYYRPNLSWNEGNYYHQQIGLPVGTPATAASWR